MYSRYVIQSELGTCVAALIPGPLYILFTCVQTIEVQCILTKHIHIDLLAVVYITYIKD